MTRLKSFLLAAVLLSSLGAAYAAPAQQPVQQLNRPQQNAALYAAAPQPLTLEQCGQCHPKHFKDIKQTGGKHQFDCRECHSIFHAYNPRKNNYAAIMPSCNLCHTLVHGEKHSQCLNCHQNPHAAQKPPAINLVVNLCSDCHANQQTQLNAFPSKRTQLSCDNCHHTGHGLIPSCAECHQPHFETQAFTECKACHDVHQPLAINLAEDVELETCAACHSDIFAKWQKTPSKHGQVSCAACHQVHKQIPQCQDCHATPASHSKNLLAKFPRCLDCHLDVHDLPTKN
ncbi:MAG: cytochrome C [Deltaproteobacteria bacterium]|nr:cytochrome C [Deltaproteobacteria bacterium]